MVQVRWTTAALEDLGAVREYARQVSAGYAEQVIERIIARTDILTNFPKAGRMVPEYHDETVRELVDGHYRIMYEVLDPSRVDILHIHHSALPLPPR